MRPSSLSLLCRAAALLLLATLTLAGAIALVRPSEATSSFGDVNCDGTVTSIDAALLLQLSAGLVSDIACATKADINNDALLDSRDAALVLQHVAGLIVIEPPVATPTPAPTNTPVLSPTPTPMPPVGATIIDVAAGSGHTCALMSTGRVWCWGLNHAGQLGNGAMSGEEVNTTPKEVCADVNCVDALSTAIQITTGSHHTCVITAAHQGLCWGDNSSGQLGDNTTDDRSTPTTLFELAGIVAIQAGSFHTCALTDAGAVYCWGRNVSGQLGNGTIQERHRSTAVTGLDSGIVALAGGGNHTCALNDESGVLCWGDGLFGQLGDGINMDRWTAVPVTELGSGVASIAAGLLHTCASTNAGALMCWGLNSQGQLGDGTTDDQSTPVPVPALTSGVTAIDGGAEFTCAVAGGSGRCWGDNVFGQLGDGTKAERHMPTTVGGLGEIVTISAGEWHTCALTTGSDVYCWGMDLWGQLGAVADERCPSAAFPDPVACSSTPIEVTGFRGRYSFLGSPYCLRSSVLSTLPSGLRGSSSTTAR